MDPLDSILCPVFQPASGDTSVVSDVSLTSLFHSFVVQEQEVLQHLNGLDWRASVLNVPESNNLGSAPHIPDTHPCLYSTSVVQLNSDAVRLGHNAAVSLGSDLPFEPESNASVLNFPEIAVQGGALLNPPGAEYASGVVLMQDPPTTNVSRIGDDVSGYSIAPFSPPQTVHGILRSLFLSQDMETKIASPLAASSTGIPSEAWGINEVPEAPASIENPLTFTFTNLVAGTDTLAFPWENECHRSLQTSLDQILQVTQNPASSLPFSATACSA
ncbi:hypothetical protein JVU11DRAFT_7632 [Chiua virens]|nr:hypothetical protein JVU11DRAFT_7632 [Chiua virens]